MTRTQQPALLTAWLPVVLGVSLIAVESTATMAAANTSLWLLKVCHALWGQTDTPGFELAHTVMRKMGHFCGYGVLSVLFYRAWYATVWRLWSGSLRGLRMEAAGLAMTCTVVIACADEWHQNFLAGRTSSIYDVLIDGGGAVLFQAVMMAARAKRKRAEAVRAVA
jgi:VanZ family protein